MKLIFLDIDGVLRVGANTETACVQELNRIVAVTGAGIVISSTWRRDVEIYSTLRSWGVWGTFIGKTPDLSQTENGLVIGVERWREIEDFLNGYSERVSRFVILDDDKDMGNFMGCLVQTDPHVGLSRADADRAIRKLLGARQERDE